MKFLFLFLAFIISVTAKAQVEPVLQPRNPGKVKVNPNASNTRNDINTINNASTARKDSIPFEHRDDSKDSISVVFHYLDSTNKQTMDSSINDFDVYYSVPSYYQQLGNNGAAAYPLIYQPFLQAGFDAGFHAFDVYKFKLEDTKFYRTRRPFSKLGYELASGKEQMISAGHTQTPRPNINFGFDYNLITAPGLFINQNNTHNASRIFGSYQSPKKRYNGTIVFQGNNIKAAQNGGIVNDALLLDPNRKERFSIPVNLGNAQNFTPDPFQTKIRSGNIYNESTLFLRQSYDLGKRDSLQINDSTMEYLFYPKLRLQYSFTYKGSRYQYIDNQSDSTIYKNWYNLNVNGNARDTIAYNEKWKTLTNDFSLIQFPDTKNLSQFFLAGITVENLTRTGNNGDDHFFNAFAHAEYRNRTRNKVWNIVGAGEFYVAGLNIGDYKASASISRYLNKRFGFVKLFFVNVNRRPSFIFDDRSAYNIGNSLNLKKENITSFGATAENSFINLWFANHLLTNYTYYKNFYQKDQYNKPINILQAGASKKISLSKHIKLYSEGVVQITDAAAPIKVPLVYTRNRLAFEGNFFKNLFLSTGLEVKYNTPYKAYNFSPLNGQFVPQDSVLISNLPVVNAFVHFRIKGFSAFIRGENLNTVSFNNGFGFVNNNFAAPHYPTQGFTIRFGVRWWFIN